MADWHYSYKGTSTGPISIDEIKRLYSSGQISETSLVWNETRGGDWVKYSDVPEFRTANVPPPLPASAVSDFWVWVMALVPLAGAAIEIAINQNTNISTDSPLTLFAYFAFYAVCISRDSKVIKDSGRRKEVGAINLWIIFLPIYFFMRSSRLGKNYSPLFVWLAGFALVIYLSTGSLNPLDLISSALPKCDSSTSIDQVKEIFPKLPMNAGGLAADEVKDITSISTTDIENKCRANVISAGTPIPVAFTIKSVGNQYQYWLRIGF